MEIEQAVAPYVIITPAHNEEAFIEKTIHSMINQTVRPLKWIVVNDNSTDRTGKIAEQYAKQYDFLQLVNLSRSGGRNFGNKVRAFNYGLNEAQLCDYQYIGNLDADISLNKDYFEKILCEFDSCPNLGIAGGMVSTCIGDKFVSQEVALDSVAGAVQLFRRECFEQIGGYLALPHGGIDAAAEIMARMKGWKTRTFADLRVFEHRRTGTATARPLASKVKDGQRFQSLGYDFLFLSLRCVYRLMDRPRVVGSVATLYGYFKGVIKKTPIVLPPNVVQYLRAEQRGKLMRYLGRSHRLQKDM
ncbi:glycosyltransferase family 2 protein [Methylobacter svalbardensis]|uniref:glycosyltransferase n=1 Tax=Methylobacter svalbardensis TaxID=3080016 RepID=UPI0030EEF4AD